MKLLKRGFRLDDPRHDGDWPAGRPGINPRLVNLVLKVGHGFGTENIKNGEYTPASSATPQAVGVRKSRGVIVAAVRLLYLKVHSDYTT